MEFDFFWLLPQPFTVQFRINSRTVCIPVVLLYLLWSAEGVDILLLADNDVPVRAIYDLSGFGL